MRGILSVWTISSSLPEEASRLKKNFLVGTYETVPFVCHVKLTFSHCSLYIHTHKRKKIIDALIQYCTRLCYYCFFSVRRHTVLVPTDYSGKVEPLRVRMTLGFVFAQFVFTIRSRTNSWPNNNLLLLSWREGENHITRLHS